MILHQGRQKHKCFVVVMKRMVVHSIRKGVETQIQVKETTGDEDSVESRLYRPT